MKKPGILLLVITYLGFISLGLPDATHGINWPFVRASFAIPNAWLGMILTGTGIGYFCSSSTAGYILSRLGVGTLLATSSISVFLGLIGFSLAPNWYVFLMFTILIGLGSGAIDAGLNAYAAEHFSTRQMNWLHAAFGMGAMFGPMIVTVVLVTDHHRWRVGYAVVGAILLSMAVLFYLTRHLLDDRRPQSDEEHAETASVRYVDVIKQTPVIFHIVLYFFYTGIEIGIGQWAFTILTQQREIHTATAGLWTSLFWGALAVGRVFFGLIVERVNIDAVIRLATWFALAGMMVFCVDSLRWFSLIGLLMLGFFLAPIFPCLMSRTPLRVGKTFAPHTIGFQVSAAMVGGVALPFTAGVISQYFGLSSISITFLVFVLILLLAHEGVLANDRRRATVAAA